MAAGRCAAVVLSLGLLIFPAEGASAQSGSATQTEGRVSAQQDQALVGTIWSAREGRAVSREELLEGLSSTPLILLGEVHDNPEHHSLRAWIIGELATRRSASGERGPAVVFEHIRADQQSLVDDFLASDERADAGALLQKLDWDRSGWPSAAMFSPLFEQALKFRLPIFAGNTPAEAIRKVAREGLASLLDEERSRLGLDQQLEPHLYAALIKDIEENHCGLVPESAFPPMALAQQYRDAHLAERMISAMAANGAAVLLAGNGHVRSDRGVPWHLRRRAPGSNIGVVTFVEADPGITEAAPYVPLDPDGQPATDYVWITSRAERPDPCEEMRQRISRP